MYELRKLLGIVYLCYLQFVIVQNVVLLFQFSIALNTETEVKFKVNGYGMSTYTKFLPRENSISIRGGRTTGQPPPP